MPKIIFISGACGRRKAAGTKPTAFCRSAYNFHGRQCHDFFFSAIGIIPPFECNLSIPDIQDSVVGNGHAVGVSSEIMSTLPFATKLLSTN